MRRTDRAAVALITVAAALAGSAGLAQTMSLGPYHHPAQAHGADLAERASSLDRLDAGLRRALASPLPPLPRAVAMRRAAGRWRAGGGGLPRTRTIVSWTAATATSAAPTSAPAGTSGSPRRRRTPSSAGRAPVIIPAAPSATAPPAPAPAPTPSASDAAPPTATDGGREVRRPPESSVREGAEHEGE